MKAQRIVDKLLEADEGDPEAYLRGLPVRFDREELGQALKADAAGWCMDDERDKQAFIDWMRAHENLIPDYQHAMQVIAQNFTWCFDNDEDIERFLNAIDPRHADNAKTNFDRYVAAMGLENYRQSQETLGRFKRSAALYIKWAHAGDEQGAGYDPADLRRLARAKTFEEAEAILAEYETDPSFLSMVSQGYFV